MLADFFFKLKAASIPVSITEYLALLEALEKQIVNSDVDDFYYLSRSALVKDERLFDKFDQVFSDYMNGVESRFSGLTPEGEIPEDWLKHLSELYLSEEEKRKIEGLGGWEKLMETLKERLKEQQKRHQGGAKWIGTAGTSPFGAYGFNPEGIRVGQHESRNRRAVKVWDKREFRNLDDNVELGTRNLKMALRRLRRFAREGAAEELDLDGTIYSTARNGGMLDIRMVPERHNAIKVLLFLDVGGSMDDHVRISEELFSAARAEFKHLEYFYFHNCVYESVWRNGRRRHTERIPTTQVMRTYGKDYKLIFVGDASMSPYEILHPGGSVEHFNDEAGAVWMKRVLEAFPCAIWLNPRKQEYWDYIPSIDIIKQLMNDQMFVLTPAGLEQAMRALSHTSRSTVTI